MAVTFAISGKGGVGKTAVAALIVRWLKEHAPGPVLALDADPDSNLGDLLGMKVETTIGDLREEALKAMKSWPAGMSKEAYIQAGLHQLIVEGDGVDLIAMGRGEGGACYCYINNLLRKFAEDLLPSYRFLVMDNEAGMEHLSRRTTTNVDHLIVVVNENPMSIDCAGRIAAIAAEMKRDIRRRYFLVNGVRPERLARARERTAGLDLEYLGCIPYDSALEELVLNGQSIFDLDGGLAMEEMDRVMSKIGGDSWTSRT